MKKVAGMLAAFAVLFGLTGCGAKTLKCTMEQGNSKMSQTFTLDKDDKVTKVTMEMIGEADTEDEAKAAEEYYKEIANDNDVAGITYSVSRSGKKVTLKGTADLSKVDADDIDTYIGTKTNSKDAVKKAFEDDGYKCN